MRLGPATAALAVLSTALVACGGSPVDTAGLTRVDYVASAPLPPPYQPTQVSLTSAASLSRFSQLVTKYGIGITSPTSLDGCAGGATYTITLVRSNVSTTLSAYDCGGSIAGNMTGDVSGFLSALNVLIQQQPGGS